MCNQALRNKLFTALRGDALPNLKELDDLVLADIDKIMPIVEAHWEAEKLAWAEFLEVSADWPTAQELKETYAKYSVQYPSSSTRQIRH